MQTGLKGMARQIPAARCRPLLSQHSAQLFERKALCLEKTTLRVRDYVQTLGLNAETKKDRHRAVGEIFVLTFPFIGLSPISAFYRLVDVATIDAVALLRHPPLVLRLGMHSF